MANPKGSHLRSIRSLDDLKDRCRIDDETGCWVWCGGKSMGAPRVHLVIDGVYRVVRGRSAAVALDCGKYLGHGLLAIAKCSNGDCVNPKHCRVGDRKEWGRAHKEAGTMKTPAKQAAAWAAGACRRVLTDEDVAAIRVSDDPSTELASRYGVSVRHINNVRCGRLRARTTLPGASVFSWRPPGEGRAAA